jgi:MraZ protein
MFRGRYQHTIDPKGRLSVPAKFRDVLAQYDGNLIVVPNDHSLEVHPLGEWERLEARINQQSAFAPEVRALGRLYVSRAKEVALDNVGRILLPPDSRQKAGLAREVTLVGPGRLFFEVWDRARFDEYERTNGEGLPSLFERLSRLGV